MNNATRGTNLFFIDISTSFAQAQWKVGSVRKAGESWKRLFFERYVQSECDRRKIKEIVVVVCVCEFVSFPDFNET